MAVCESPVRRRRGELFYLIIGRDYTEESRAGYTGNTSTLSQSTLGNISSLMDWKYVDQERNTREAITYFETELSARYDTTTGTFISSTGVIAELIPFHDDLNYVWISCELGETKVRHAGYMARLVSDLSHESCRSPACACGRPLPQTSLPISQPQQCLIPTANANPKIIPRVSVTAPMENRQPNRVVDRYVGPLARIVPEPSTRVYKAGSYLLYAYYYVPGKVTFRYTTGLSSSWPVIPGETGCFQGKLVEIRQNLSGNIYQVNSLDCNGNRNICVTINIPSLNR